MKETKAQIMEGIEATKSKLVANNTVEYERPDGTKVVRLHHTDILEQKPDGSLIFNSGGWKTSTTKDRLNNFQSSATIIQDKGLWYLTRSLSPYKDKDSWVPFFDGITLKDGKVVNAQESPHQEDKRLLKLIQDYCKELKNLPKLPIPSNGDCWYCLMKTDDGKSLGDMSGNSDHLLSHLEEKYIHGSLIFNALKERGYASPEVIFSMDVRTSIVSSVRKYFKSHLGLAA